MNQMIDNKNQGEHSSRFACVEIRKHLPSGLLPKVTVLLQDSGYVTISPRELSRHDWRNMNKQVRQMGGLWVSNQDTVIGASPFPEH